MTSITATLQSFFTDRLVRQHRASPNTIASYRDTIRLLLAHLATTTGIQPSGLDWADLDAPRIAGFLDHLEHDRGNTVATRNNRLAAIHSLFSYAALEHPEHAATIARVLAIPAKRTDRAVLTYLTEAEVDALLAASDPTTWTGRRDHALLAVAVATGLRISELIGLTRADIHLGRGPHVACHGKGRKDRITPLTRPTVNILRDWLTELRPTAADTPVFPTKRGTPLSRDAVEHRIAGYLTAASADCPSLASKRVTAHTLRHTTAMRLLHAGVDSSVIALWLGHASVETTHSTYLHADLAIKQKALARTRPPNSKPGRYQPPDRLLAWLETL